MSAPPGKTQKPMKTYQHSSNLSSTIVLPISGVKDWVFQLLMVATAVILPALAHLSGAPVRWLLPMHWSVIFAAMIYGWRGGVMVGSLAPASNYLITGYPLLIKALPMTFELAVYGLIIGMLCEKGWNKFAAIAVGLLIGRIVFLGVILLTGANEVVFTQYLIAAMMPGLVAGLGQIVILPAIAERYLGVVNSKMK
ncbi:MAG: hypothetical protein HQ568_07705 [Calditrichaeota bacterium]|nr:hypothetical protein [Calditrichota bacterium]